MSLMDDVTPMILETPSDAIYCAIVHNFKTSFRNATTPCEFLVRFLYLFQPYIHSPTVLGMKEISKKREDPRNSEFSNAIITLDVGGKIYKTSLQTITKDSASMLAAMFSGRFKLMSREKDGSFFIDRDGETFRYILNYLRNGTLIYPDDATIQQEILQEAEFYQIQGIIDDLESPALLREKSVIVKHKEHDRKISSWMPANSECFLLYRATRDGWSAADFHRLCDDKGYTLVLVQSTDGFIGGGYTTKSWEASRVEKAKQDKDSFVFTLTNPSQHKPTKLNSKSDLHNNQGGIICTELTGPYFGTRNYFDLKILNQNDMQITTNINNYADLGHGFECPAGLHSKMFMFGSGTFYLNELEVFSIY